MYDFASPVERKVSTTSSPTKYDMRLNPIYQIDFQNCAAGKHISATKRRVRFRFGFSNAEAIQQGLIGSECRGEEHEVNLTWSLTSGKRLVLMDGDEVHFSMGNRTETLFETSWTMAGGHIIKIIAHAAPPLFVTPGFRQFDLLLDGCSTFDMPRIFELGKKSRFHNDSPRRVQSSTALTPIASSSPAYSTRSLPEAQPQHCRTAATTPTIASAPDLLEASPANQDYLDSSSSSILTAQDEFTPVAQASTPPPSFALVSNQIMSSYDTTAPPAATPQPMLAISNEAYNPTTAPAAPVTPPYHQEPSTPPSSYYAAYQTPQWEQGAQATFYQPEQPAAPMTPVTSPAASSPPPQVESSPSSSDVAPRLTMEPLSVSELEARDQPQQLSDYDRTLRALVNFDDITETNETPEQCKSNKKKAVMETAGKSKPLPPVTPDWHVGMNASLGDIRQHVQPKAAPKKEIMRTHAFDPAAVQAGMMVVYGATGTGGGYGHYYPPQQQQQPMMYASSWQQQQPQPVMSRAF